MKFVIFSLLFALVAAKDLPSEHIVGGDPVIEGMFPYMISLQWDNDHNCGGSILSEEWVMTAAHCVEGISPGQFDRLTSVAGEHNLTEESGREQRSIPIEIHIHEEYDNFNLYNDIALIKLQDPFVFDGEFVKAIPGREQRVEVVQNCTVVGWGSTTGVILNYPDTPYYVILPMVSDEECEIYMGPIPDTQECAGVIEGGKDSCFADSGGPLMVLDDERNGVQSGIVSWGPNFCALEEKFGVYTEIAYYNDWIDSKMAGGTN